MGLWVAQECVRLLIDAGRPVKGARVLVLGLTFKEDVPDVRNTRVIDVINELRRFGAEPVVCDPVADAGEAHHEYGIDLHPLTPLPRAEAVIVAVAHRQIRALTPATLVAAVGSGAPCLDLKGVYDRQALLDAGLVGWRL